MEASSRTALLRPNHHSAGRIGSKVPHGRIAAAAGCCGLRRPRIPVPYEARQSSETRRHQITACGDSSIGLLWRGSQSHCGCFASLRIFTFEITRRPLERRSDLAYKSWHTIRNENDQHDDQKQRCNNEQNRPCLRQCFPSPLRRFHPKQKDRAKLVPVFRFATRR